MSEIELQQQPDDARARTETHDPSEIARAEDPTCVGIYGAAGALDGTDITDEVSLFVWLNRLAQHRPHFPITVLENERVCLDSFFAPARTLRHRKPNTPCFISQWVFGQPAENGWPCYYHS